MENIFIKEPSEVEKVIKAFADTSVSLTEGDVEKILRYFNANSCDPDKATAAFAKAIDMRKNGNKRA